VSFVASNQRVSTLNKVIDVKAIAPHSLRIAFSDGATGVHHFGDILQEPGPMAEPLKDPDYFARVSLMHGAPTWPNGYDMCPDWLRMEMESAGEIHKPSVD
jgi:hypothetical protein